MSLFYSDETLNIDEAALGMVGGNNDGVITHDIKKLANGQTEIKVIYYSGLLGIAPTRNCTNLFEIGFMAAGGGFYSYYIHQGNKSDKERKIVRKKLRFMNTKGFFSFFKRWMQFRVGAILRLPAILYLSLIVMLSIHLSV